MSQLTFNFGKLGVTILLEHCKAWSFNCKSVSNFATPIYEVLSTIASSFLTMQEAQKIQLILNPYFCWRLTLIRLQVKTGKKEEVKYYIKKWIQK